MSQTKKLITIADAAEQISVSTDTIRRLINRGVLSCVRVGSRAVRVKQTEIDAYIERGQFGGAA